MSEFEKQSQFIRTACCVLRIAERNFAKQSQFYSYCVVRAAYCGKEMCETKPILLVLRAACCVLRKGNVRNKANLSKSRIFLPHMDFFVFIFVHQFVSIVE